MVSATSDRGGALHPNAGRAAFMLVRETFTRQGYRRPPRLATQAAGPRWACYVLPVIHDLATATRPSTPLRADLIVVGAGPGGLMAAMVAAEAGLGVVVLEAGPFVPPSAMNQREDDMLPLLYAEAGTRMSADRGVHIHQGRGLGGSTLHNLNLCKRIPTAVLADWRRQSRLGHLSEGAWAGLYAEVEALLSVSEVPEAMVSPHNDVLRRGMRALGWRGGLLRHNRTGCVQSGFCALGCSFDAKNNAAKVALPRAVDAGAVVLTHAEATRIMLEPNATSGRPRVAGVQVRALGAEAQTPRAPPRGELVVRAPRVCVSASATGTAALLLRSDVPHPAGSIGDTLRLHPAVVAAGRFEAPIDAWRGVPQSIECTELLDFDAAHGGDTPPPRTDGQPGSNRVWIVPAFAHPMATATMLPGLGAQHAASMARYRHLAVLTAMVHDRSAGRVRPRGERGVRIDYAPDEADRRDLRAGLVASARLLLAAGAAEVFAPTEPMLSARTVADLEAWADAPIGPRGQRLTAVHPMGSVPMDDDPKRAFVDSAGRSHHVEGLFVADGSLFPTSIGVPPQLSIFAMGLHVGRAIVGAA